MGCQNCPKKYPVFLNFFADLKINYLVKVHALNHLEQESVIYQKLLELAQVTMTIVNKILPDITITEHQTNARNFYILAVWEIKTILNLLKNVKKLVKQL